MIRIADIDDAGLEKLVLEHRNRAGQAEETIAPGRYLNEDKRAIRPFLVAQYRSIQNGWADIYQELLDRRRAVEPITQQ
jgi:hypothetical protein